MVEWKLLGEVCEILDSQRRPVSKGERNQGVYPYYGANGIQDYVDSYIFDGTFLLLGEDGSVINKDKSPVLHWAEGKIWVNNHAHILKENKKALLRYLYYSLQCTDVSDIVRGVPPKINQANMRAIPLPIPSLSEQNRIVGILDTFTSCIENLKQQIAERRKQYEYYRDQLLDLEGREKVEINSIASFVKERISASNLTPYNYTSVENLLKDKAGRQDAENVPAEGNWTKYQRGDILIGNIRPYLRKIWLSDREGGTNGDVMVIRPKDGLLPKFLYYCLSSESFFLYYNQSLKDGKMPRGEKSRVLSFVIPLIEKIEQSRIVSILDTFEASIANLEAQLKEREKQYEYYRNQLLTFK